MSRTDRTPNSKSKALFLLACTSDKYSYHFFCSEINQWFSNFLDNITHLRLLKNQITPIHNVKLWKKFGQKLAKKIVQKFAKNWQKIVQKNYNYNLKSHFTQNG